MNPAPSAAASTAATQSPMFEHVRWVARVAAYIDRAAACDAPVASTGLAFRIDCDGRISDIRIAHGSGDAALDAQAIDRLHAIGTVPAAPAGTPPRTHVAVIAVGAKVHALPPVAARRLVTA